MNNIQKDSAAAAETTKRVAGAFLTTLADVGAAWATHGLKIGKMALATSAETLGKTAQLLDTLAVELEKKKAAAPTDDVAAPVEKPAVTTETTNPS